MVNNKQRCTYTGNNKMRSCNHRLCEKAISITYSECFHIPTYPACKTHAPLWFYHIFPQYLIKLMFFWKKLVNIKCVFWFSVQILSETFLILTRNERVITINVHRFTCKAHVLFIIISFSRRISEKYLSITFHRNTSSGTQAVPCRQTERGRERRADGKTDVTKLLVAFLNFTNAPKKWNDSYRNDTVL